MQIVPPALLSTGAGASLAQTKGTEGDRQTRDAAIAERGQVTDRHADEAAGIGQTEQDQGSSERDADGRRLWEDQSRKSSAGNEIAPVPPRPRDPTGMAGGSLDLVG